MRVKDATHWRPWFAWRPVHIADRWIWLEWVERRNWMSRHAPEGEYRLWHNAPGIRAAAVRQAAAAMLVVAFAVMMVVVWNR